MKRNLLKLAKLYQMALRSHLKDGGQAGLESARDLGGQALASGLQTLDLAKLHEQTLVVELLPGCPARERAARLRRAGTFFAAAATPIEQSHRGEREAALHLSKVIQTLSQRTVELAASNLELSREITRGKAVAEALQKSELHYSQLLKQSSLFQEQLRRLSRQILSAQEDERRKISRELHDVIAQALTGINVRLATLKRSSG